MRIIDNRKKKDYYDIGQNLGHDDSIVYLRNFQEKFLNRIGTYEKFYDPFVVGFCGNLYPAVRLVNSNYDYKKLTHNTVISFCYNIEDVDKFVQTHCDKKEIENYEDKKIVKLSGGRIYYHHGLNKCIMIDYFKKSKEIYKRLQDKFVQYNCPIFVYDYKHLYINPILNDFHFYKVFDAYAAYQEVAMYVGGVLLSKTNPIPEVSDQIRLESHGFDKHSFRKDKSKE
jgi:hypothetical protein